MVAKGSKSKNAAEGLTDPLKFGVADESLTGLSQLDKFKEAARELETDDDEARFEERLGKLVKQKPAPQP